MDTNRKPATCRAATYARYSSENQKESSIEDQQRKCRKRAEAEGWSIVAQFEDKAISGSDKKRPGYVRMQEAAPRKEFDVLLVDDLSRLTRDSVEQETVIRRLEYQGIRIVSTSDGYDSLSKARKIHRGMKGLMNEMFLDDLREKIHRGLEGQAIKKFWCGGKPYGYKLKPVFDAARLDPYGNPAKIGTVLVIDKAQAAVVKEAFTRFAAGESCLAIAADFNARKIPSAGSTWKRKVRRASGWMSSSVRSMVVNPLYTGRQRWNASQFVKDPDTGKYLRHKRPKSEWVVNQIEALRIVSDELFERARQCTSKLKDGDSRLKRGGKPKYLLSGVLRCAVCDANYVIADALSYACSSFLHGGRGACTNGVRVNRKSLEDTILGPIRVALKDKDRVAKMAKEMQAKFAKEMQERTSRAAAVPAELRAIDERLAKLRTMPDLTDDERQMLVEKAQAKRAELEAQQPDAKQSAKILAMLPRAAETYVKQIDDGLEGDAGAALKAKVILRDLLGPVSLSPGDHGSLWATYDQNLWALVRTTGTLGRGDRI